MKKKKLRSLRYLLMDDIVMTTQTCLEQDNVILTKKHIKMVARKFLHVAKAALVHGNAVKLLEIGTIYPSIYNAVNNKFIKGDRVTRFSFRASRILKRQAEENKCAQRVVERYNNK